jgi:ribonuclease BN (tRNA processing enzyme)
MRLDVVGCSGSGPGPRSPASCYAVSADGFTLVLDLGQGAAGPLQAVVDPAAIGAISLSHLHSDHCLDMTALGVVLQYGPRQPSAPIPVFAPDGAAARIAAAVGPETPPESLRRLFDFRPPTDATIGPFAVRFARMNHPVPAHAIRVEHAGRALVFSGDTGRSPALVELARDCDLLLIEAGWGGAAEPAPNIHLTGTAAGEHARDAGAGRLVLTHIPAWGSVPAVLAEARAVFSGPTTAAYAGMSVDV